MTANYLIFLFCCSVLCALLGLAGHVWRSEVGTWPGQNEDPIYEKGFLVVLAPREDRALEKKVINADWDEYGWWEFASIRNIVYYVGGGAAGPWIMGMLYWPDRDNIMLSVCSGFARIGITPLFCP